MGAASAVFGVNQFLVGGLVAAALSLLAEPSPLPLAVDDGGRGLRLRCPMVGLAAQARGLAAAGGGTRRLP